MPEVAHISFAGPLKALAPISLDEMDAVKLMNRIDTKYLTDEKTLLGVLADAAAAGYRVLVAEGARISPYDSVYYDTEGLRMFSDHHNKRLRRQKVRTRAYVNSGSAFLEIKRKNNRGRTKKKRTEIPVAELPDFRADEAACRYLAGHSDFDASQLRPSVETLFQRITLVNPDLTERLTIDTRLCFKNFRTGLETSLLDAVIIELKQDGHAASQMKGILLAHRVKPARISKYCIAVTLTDPGAKSNRFKVKVRQIEKTINHKITVA
ncbi:MAG: polyphosphate polymerase domain-containing protein [Bacteroidales bacterium]|nr:polyphosphate polymerase domain-containing protein [Bacteroidales bacterium]